MAQGLKLSFASMEKLCTIWDEQLKRGMLFIPSGRMLAVDSDVVLTLRTRGVPVPLKVLGTVRRIREPDRCAGGQKPGFEVKFTFSRDQRKGLKAYMREDWLAAVAVMPPGAATYLKRQGFGDVKARQQKEATRKRDALSTKRAGSVVSVSRVKPAPKNAPIFAELDPSADDFLERLEEEANRQLERFEGKNHYQVLGVEPTAVRKQIRSRYLQWMKMFHPDKYFRRLDFETQKALEGVYQHVTVSYETLVDTSARDEYDEAEGIPRRAASEVR